MGTSGAAAPFVAAAGCCAASVTVVGMAAPLVRPSRARDGSLRAPAGADATLDRALLRAQLPRRIRHMAGMQGRNRPPRTLRSGYARRAPSPRPGARSRPGPGGRGGCARRPARALVAAGRRRARGLDAGRPARRAAARGRRAAAPAEPADPEEDAYLAALAAMEGSAPADDGGAGRARWRDRPPAPARAARARSTSSRGAARRVRADRFRPGQREAVPPRSPGATRWS